MNGGKGILIARCLPNPQSSSAFTLSKPVPLRAGFSLTAMLAHSQVEELHGNLICNQSSTKPVRPSSLPPQLAQSGLLPWPQLLQPGPTPHRPPWLPATARGKRGEGPDGSHTPTPTNHHSLVQPGYAENERFHRAPLGRGWGCSSAPGYCHRCSGD